MLSDEKFHIVRNAVRHWGTVGHPRSDHVARENADTMKAIRAAVAEGKDYAGLIPDAVREQARLVIEEEIKHGADELERVRKGLDDVYADALEKLVVRHNLSLPAFTSDWNEPELVAWWAAIAEPDEKLKAFGEDFRKWWDMVGNQI